MARAAVAELLLDPLRQVRLAAPAARRQVEAEHLPGLDDGLRQRGVELDVVADQREHGRRRGPLEVLLDGLQVGRLPALDTLDDDEPALDREEPERVAGGGDVLTARLVRAQLLGRILADAVPEPS